MQLSRIDLNLFTVFDAIFREGGITPASRRLHLSQPAVSHALARLREVLGDPLFKRRGNAMIPTPFARELAATVGGSLSAFDAILQRSGRFDPALSRRRFTLAVRDSNEAAFLPALMATMRREARHVDVACVRIERRDLEEDLESGELDAAVDIGLALSSAVRRERLSAEPLVVLARKKHAVLKHGLDLAAYLAAEHVLVTARRHGGGYEDIALGRLGLTRRVRLRCQLHAAASDVVSRTDLLVTMSRAQASLVKGNNRVLPFPARIAPLTSYIYWHANVDADAGHQWFRRKVTHALRGGRALKP